MTHPVLRCRYPSPRLPILVDQADDGIPHDLLPRVRPGAVPALVFHVFFFFQAEDGIRDDLVTGVQTCALPISLCAQDAKVFQVEPGTHIPLSLINSVSTKNSAPGDRVYLETVFPILVDGKIVIPPGSYVAGTITEVQRPGKVKGRGEFHLRFDSLTLPNGTTRDFRARVSGLDGRASEELDRKEGTIRSEGNKAGDARTVGETTAAGASVGALAGSLSGATGMGAGIGAAAGAAAGLMGVLLTRGPEA